MIYANMWSQMNAGPIISSYHTFLELAVINHFAIIIMMSWITEEDRRGDISHCLRDTVLCARSHHVNKLGFYVR